MEDNVSQLSKSLASVFGNVYWTVFHVEIAKLRFRDATAIEGNFSRHMTATTDGCLNCIQQPYNKAEHSI